MYIKMNLVWGPIVIGLNHKAEIFGLWFEGQKYFPVIEENSQTIVINDTENINIEGEYVNDTTLNKRIIEVVKQLREYEKGQRKVFDLKLDPSGTDFRKIVWEVLKEIEYGKTTTYGNIGKDVAKTMNKSTMSGQAVGGAVGHNPISIVIPCHRVIGSDGSLTGYAGGVDKKRAILKHESRYV